MSEPMRVLLVEDDDAHATLILRAVRGVDRLSVERVGDGHAMLERLVGRAFDLVLLDLKMDGMGGIDALRRVRRHADHVGLRVVVVTSSCSHDDVEAAADAGVDGYLVKPVRFGELRAQLLSTIERFRPGVATG